VDTPSKNPTAARTKTKNNTQLSEEDKEVEKLLQSLKM
jgi:hypothetical protein